jgi:hypothetical protein
MSYIWIILPSLCSNGNFERITNRLTVGVDGISPLSAPRDCGWRDDVRNFGNQQFNFALTIYQPIFMV